METMAKGKKNKKREKGTCNGSLKKRVPFSRSSKLRSASLQKSSWNRLVRERLSPLRFPVFFFRFFCFSKFIYYYIFLFFLVSPFLKRTVRASRRVGPPHRGKQEREGIAISEQEGQENRKRKREALTPVAVLREVFPRFCFCDTYLFLLLFER